MNAIAISCATLILGCIGGLRMISGEALALAVLFGIVYTTTVFLMIKAIGEGAVGLTITVCNMSIAFPVLYGNLFCGETISALTGLGMVISIIAIAAITQLGDKGQKTNNPKRWLLLSLGASLGTGVLGILKKAISFHHPDLPTVTFSLWGFGTAAAVCWGIVLVLRAKGKRTGLYREKWRPFFLCSAGSGIGSAFGNMFQMSALEIYSTVVVFSLTAIVVPLILCATSIWVYKELRFSKRNMLVIALCLGGVFLTCIG